MFNFTITQLKIHFLTMLLETSFKTDRKHRMTTFIYKNVYICVCPLPSKCCIVVKMLTIMGWLLRYIS